MERIEIMLMYILRGDSCGETIEICDFTFQEQIKMESQIHSTRGASTGKRSSEEFKRKKSNTIVQKKSPYRRIKVTDRGLRPTISTPMQSENKIETSKNQTRSSSPNKISGKHSSNHTNSRPESTQSSRTPQKTNSKPSNEASSNIPGKDTNKITFDQRTRNSSLILDRTNSEKVKHNVSQHSSKTKRSITISPRQSSVWKGPHRKRSEHKKEKSSHEEFVKGVTSYTKANKETLEYSSTSKTGVTQASDSKESHATKTGDSKRPQNPDLLPPSTYGRSVMAENVSLDVDEIDSEYVPVVNRTVHYVVAGIFVNEKGEVLLIEESQPTRRGQWCIPAGNINTGEDLDNAFRRIVEQETGLEVEAVTLLLVEYSSAEWFRFVMTGNIIGGKLKRHSPDGHSLRAAWFSDFTELKLRGGDEILPIIECGRMYNRKKGTRKWHKDMMPIKRPQQKLYFRMIFCLTKSPNNLIRVLLIRFPEYHFPVCELHPSRNFHLVMTRFLEKLFGSDLPANKVHGVLSVEHKGIAGPTPLDGFCFTLLVSCKKRQEHFGLEKSYIWLEVAHVLGEEILNRMRENMCVQFRAVGVH